MNLSLWIATKEQKEQLNSNQVTKKLSSEPVWLIWHFKFMLSFGLKPFKDLILITK